MINNQFSMSKFNLPVGKALIIESCTLSLVHFQILFPNFSLNPSHRVIFEHEFRPT